MRCVSGPAHRDPWGYIFSFLVVYNAAMAGDTVEEIKARLSIVDVVSQYMKLERAGSAMKGRCPFHNEKTPSFHVSPGRGTYHCFGCGVGGDIFSFVQAIEGVDFKGALKILADRAGVQVVSEKPGERDERQRQFALLEDATQWFEDNMKEMEAARVYLSKRGLSEGSRGAFRIGWAPDSWNGLTDYLRGKGFTEAEVEHAGLCIPGNRGRYDRFRSRIMFPISDSAGRVVAFSGRIFIPEGARAHTVGTEEPAKYINSPETALFKKSKILYGYDRAKNSIRKFNCAILVEGQMDLVLSHQAGWANTVAVSGTALTTEHVEMLKRMTDNLILALDADRAGIAAAAKSARAALAAGLAVKVATVPVGKDPADLIAQEGPEAWRAVVRDARPIITFLLDVVEQNARDREGLRRNVLASVVPFVLLIGSAIEREAAVREIAARIGVSETAVMQDVQTRAAQEAAEPRDSYARAHDSAEAPPVTTDPSRTRYTSRVEQLFGILMWQEALPVASVDVIELSREVERAAGAEALAQLRSMSSEEIERIRFLTEARHTADASLPKVIAELTRAIERDRLVAEVAELTEALREAEKKGDSDTEAQLLAILMEKGTMIAKLDKMR